MDWTIGLFFWTIFWTNFWTIFWILFWTSLFGPFNWGRGEVGHKYLGRGGMQSISTREGEKNCCNWGKAGMVPFVWTVYHYWIHLSSSCHWSYANDRDPGVPILSHCIHKRYRNVKVCTFTINTLLVVLFKAIFSLFRYTVFRLKVPFPTTYAF